MEDMCLSQSQKIMDTLGFTSGGQNENSIDLKLENAGYGGESIEMSNDGGFIIGTSGSTIIKTDQELNF